ncbi:MAG TPA: CHAP domain-containing protein [Kineosporiaceae bacterium]|nr:CHAP domain-containing protein [Kineosporiaceae bacterium]
MLERFKKQTAVYPLGNGDAWNFANSTGAVSTAPRANSVIVFQPGQNGAGNRGHVAWVEQVSGNQIQIAEMDFEGRRPRSGGRRLRHLGPRRLPGGHLERRRGFRLR